MPNVIAPDEVVAPIAGIALVHRIGEGIQLAAPVNASWSGSVEREEPIVLSHQVGDVTIDGLTAVMEVEPWSTYYADAAGHITVRFYSHEDGVPEFLLRTERAGYEYAVVYGAVPTRPQIRMDKEMSAYTLALAARRRGVIAHGCGFVLPTGRAALCLGVSGAGKSTLGRMMLERTDVRVLNDDRIALTREADGIHAWGTPWPGRAGIARAGDAPLGVLAFISRGESHRVLTITARDALYRLLSTVALPLWNTSEVDESLSLLEKLILDVPVVDLSYPLSADTPAWIERTLTDITR
jgi:hypothetical protein